MIVAPLHRHFSATHLVAVMQEMRVRGAPRLRAHHDAGTGFWLAMEGTHRLRAAYQLGLRPVLIPIPWWRGGPALERARFAALDYGYDFQ